MSAFSSKTEIEIAGIKIFLTQKRIRSLHLRISAPDGEVRASAPLRYGLARIKEFILQKIEWIKKNQIRIRKLRDEGKIILPKKFISGEEHYFFGEKFLLELVQNSTANKVLFKISGVEVSQGKVSQGKVIELHVKKLSNLAQRQKLMDNFYRKHLKEVVPGMITKYEEKMGVAVAEFRVKKMKTRWGTCNVKARRIWLSLELAKKPLGFLESTVVHEMVHLLERGHNKKFYGLMDQFMPEWQIWDKKKIEI
jgi:predicted metal-dependent hydrolase